MKKYLKPKTAKILFLFITMFMLFAAGLLSSDFNYKNINEFSLLASENNISKYNDSEVSATGRITSSPYQKFNNTYFDFKIAKLEIFNKEANKSAQFKNCGNIFIKYKSKDSNTLRINDFIQLDISEVQSYTNNSGNISSIFIATKIVDVKEQGLVSYFYSFKSKIHECLNYLFFKSLSEKNAKVACALILGNQANIPLEIIESFKKSGIYHLLAISGLHISIIALFIFQILKKICSPLRSGKIIISCIIVLFLIFYNFIVGEKASMLRASIMFGLVFFSRDLFKDYKQSNVLLISYIILLLARPDFLTNIGFILSFASVAALIYIAPLLKKYLEHLLNLKNVTDNYFIKSIIAAFSINIFILPIFSYNFSGFSLISIFTNLASAPVFYILLLDLFVSSIAAVVWFAAGSFLVMPANFLMNIIIKLSDFFNSLPYGFIKTEIFKNKTIIYLYYLFLIIIFAAISHFLKKRNKE
ncbi:MAG: ComEC/Rec2 family competence protein [Candidatus Humimicrobiaceae bacterium]